MQDHKSCGRPVYDGEKCICHSEKQNKDVELFQTELDTIFADEKTDFYDLTRFIFPEVGYELPKEYKKDVWFDHSKFLGQAIFYEARFLGFANFVETEFSKGTSFYKTFFSGAVWFSFAKFSAAANFSCAQFSQSASFAGAVFSGETLFDAAVFKEWVDFTMCEATVGSRLVFDGEFLKDRNRIMFHGTAAFIKLSLADPKGIIFSRINLEKCSFLETDISEAQFTDVEWPEKGGFFEWGKRKVVCDEIYPDWKWLKWNKATHRDILGVMEEPPKYQHNLVAQLYRRLQANYISNYRFPEAGDFYIGEQEMMRKAKGKIRQYLCTNFLYKIISYYGESFTLPLLWLLLTLFVFPALLLYGGVNLDYDSQTTGFVETVNYDWTWSPKDLLPLKNDYWKAFAVNISFVTFHRSEIGEYLPEIGQRVIVNLQILLVIALAAFFLLALRRKFKRKSF